MSSYTFQEMVDLTSAGPRTISLRTKVQAAVAPYASLTSAISPFTAAEIMVMAWVCRLKQNIPFISDEEVSDWMFTTFGYYRKMALKELYEHSFQKCVTTFNHKKRFHDLAFQRTIQIERMDVPLEEHPSSWMRGYTSTLPGARRFLRRTLGFELTGFDRFFKLPVEIRILIYEEVFRCHTNGVQYNDAEFHLKSRIRRLRLSQRGKRPCWDYQEDWTQTGVNKSRPWWMRDNYPSATERTTELMALLLVNRQIFEEAMPVFYDVNHFHATSLQELTSMLKYCGGRRRLHFTSISVSYAQNVGPKTAKKAFKLLEDVKRLRRLEIETADTDFTSGIPQPLDIGSVPRLSGIQTLRKVRVKELCFPLACPLIEAYLRQTMVLEARDEAKGKAGGKGKSRKSSKMVKNRHNA